MTPDPRVAILKGANRVRSEKMSCDFDPEAPKLFFQAVEPPPTARPIGATVEDTDIVVSVATDQGPIDVLMSLAFAKHLVLQLRDAARETRNPNRILRS
jgi:hypothetical protein